MLLQRSAPGKNDEESGIDQRALLLNALVDRLGWHFDQITSLQLNGDCDV